MCGAGCPLPGVVEEALRLAMGWGVEDFSVAVLDSSALLPGYHRCLRETFTPRSAAEGREGERMAPFLLSMDVLRQLQWGLAKGLLEAATTQLPRGSTLREGGDAQRIPRDPPRRVRFALEAGAEEGAPADPGRSDPTPTKKGDPWKGFILGEPASTPHSTSGFQLAKNGMVHMPWTIRVFLPIPEESFLDEVGMDGDFSKRDPTESSAQSTTRPQRRPRGDAPVGHLRSESGGGGNNPPAAASMLPFIFSLHSPRVVEEPSGAPSERSQSVHAVRPTLKEILNAYFGNSVQLN
ncbi:unnamed protein product [Phytomonas sp. EM1]|nr:unnamed protein product [Phytomonas sp. EM1]|eukprot:CCW60627.1 unnamed protein product [Phytomonas sp. isolate EM1]